MAFYPETKMLQIAETKVTIAVKKVEVQLIIKIL